MNAVSYPSNLFTVSTKHKELVSELSTLGLRPGSSIDGHIIENGKQECGFTIVSDRTGARVVWIREGSRRNAEDEIEALVYRPMHGQKLEAGQTLEGWKVILLND